MDNQRIAEIFQEIGDILEIKGENRFRVLAYQKAALIISQLGRELADIYRENPKNLEEIPGIGKDLAAKIVEMLTTGKCHYHADILKTFPHGLLDILRLRTVGPKKVKLFYSELKIDNIEKLRKAAQEGKLRDLPKMGEKSEHEILTAIDEYEQHQERMSLSEALYLAKKVVAHMEKCKDVKRVEYAGSLRRMKETIGDLDILATGKNHAKIADHFLKFPEIEKVIAQGETKTSVILQNGVQVDLRVLDANIFGAAMHYFTGSKEHNVAIRDRAKKKGLKISEYGVFEIIKKRSQKEPEEKLIAGKTEEEVFKSVGLPFIEPLLRENRGEIEAAIRNKLPKTVELQDLRGDLHVHSKWSDGSEEIETVARGYRDAGYEYIALTDHSPSMGIVHGLTPERFKLQWAEIDELNEDFQKEAAKGKPPFFILKGTEVDIMPDGSLDLPDSCLKKMDVVVASVHSRFNMSEKEMTARILKALTNPYVTILGHPSGRLINEREPYAVDMERVINECIKRGVALEINSQPSRLDLFDYYCKLARDKGAMFSIDSDSHAMSQIDYLSYGVSVAKRGWVTKKSVINTMELTELRKWLRG